LARGVNRGWKQPDGIKLGPLRAAGSADHAWRRRRPGLRDVELNAFRETGSRIVHGY
jgi:hypothetical protein